MGIEKVVEISARRPLLTILFWLLLLGGAGFLIATSLNSALTTNQEISTSTESEKALNLIEERLDRKEKINELIIVKSKKYTVSQPIFRDFVFEQQSQLNKVEEVESTVSFYDNQNPALVSIDQSATYIVTTFKGDLASAQKSIGEIEDLVEKANNNLDFYVYNSGSASINHDFQEIAESDLQKGEAFGIPVALIVLILVFGAVGAAILPIILSLVSIAIALGLVAVAGQVFSLSFFVTNMITMMGLAVGIDYALFIISRFREERSKGLDKFSAISVSGRTAGRAVFFSGITVVLALMGLLIVPTNVFQSLAAGAIFVVVVAVLSALSLLPALLSLLGDRVNFLRVPWVGGVASAEGSNKGFWNGVTRLVMKYPWISLELSAGLLLLLTLPVFAINIGSSGVSSLPEELPSRAGFDILREEFSGGLVAPTQIVLEADLNSNEVKNSLSKLEENLRENPLIPTVLVETHPDKNIAIVTVPISSSSDSKASQVVAKIRSESVPNAFGDSAGQVFVGGTVAENLDFTNLVKQYLPIVFAFVLGLSFLLLLAVFRSLVVPAKAIIMNLLSVGASYGLLVLVFQEGVGNELLGFQQVPQIESWIPLFLFAILFGLSMDYHVFLLSRIKERFDQTKNNDEAVSFGLSSTARLITGAALIMVAVFSAFAAGQLVMFQQVGFGLAVAVLLDATIVRTILVPASMKLLGDRNWYFPKWLEWIPKIGIEG